MKPAKPQKTKVEASKNTMRRIDRFWLCWGKFRFYRAIGTTLLSLLLLLYAIARTYSGKHDPAQLRFVENPDDPTVSSAADAGQTLKPILTGEAHDTAQRLRECGALLMAVSLSAFEEFRTHGSFPVSINSILTGIQKRSLLPPGNEIRNGTLHSPLSELKLTYRSDPFSFEIFSLPLKEVQGPALMFRFPLLPGGANSVMYFESSKQQVLPAPFSTAEQLAAAGWNIRHWRGESLPLDGSAVRDLQESDAWLKSQIQK